jgi:hypothetical protein
MKEGGHLEELDIDGTILLSGWSKNWGWKGMDYIQVAQVRTEWWIFVNTLMSPFIA